MVKRKTNTFRKGEIIEVEEHHDGNYGAPGKIRQKRKKLTKEQMRVVNHLNKTKGCRYRLLQYFDYGDIFATWTYNVANRPKDMAGALKDFQKAMRKVRVAFKKRGVILYWIRNIEKGTKGAWHIHLVIKECGDTASIIENAWEKGGTWCTQIKKSKFYDEDFTKLAEYMTKDEYTVEVKKDGTIGKPRIKESNYQSSRNMPLPEPEVDKLVRWKKEVKPKKGYYIAKIYEGINPITGFLYRRYTMISLCQKEIGKRKGVRINV